jgi:predicted nucleic-acid-binding protein
MTKFSVDTNVLVRLFVDDDPAQTEIAVDALSSAEIMAISLQAFCELSWVLSSTYQVPLRDIAAAIRRLLDTSNVITNRPAVEAGLAVLDAGGDFADGVIAYDGQWLGASTFLTFDKKAARILAGHGTDVKLLERER